MVMRISSIQAFNNGVSGLGRNYSNLIRKIGRAHV